MNNTEPEEHWRPIAGWSDLYLVSSLGRVQSLPRWYVRNGVMVLLDGRIMRGGIASHGYLTVNLYREGRKINHCIHRLVAKAFLENPEEKRTVNHLNGIKADNRVENLEWATDRENNHHARRTGLMSTTGEAHGQSKLTKEDIPYIRAMRGIKTQQELADEKGVSISTICSIQLGKTWKHLQ